MIEGIDELCPAVKAINSHMLLIVATILALPLFTIAVLKLKDKN